MRELELNREYDYAGICDAYEWEKVNGGGKRKRQLEAVKAAYEWHHPINPKTGKPNNRLYVFTKQLSEVVYEDGRKGNGRKPVIPDTQFEILLANTVQKYGFEVAPVSDTKTRALLFTSEIFAGFGFDVYGTINKLREDAKWARGNKLVDTMLSGCAINKAHAYSIARIARQNGEKKASLPKEVVLEDSAPGRYKEASIELSSEFFEAYEIWKYILTAYGELPADGAVAMSAREMARKEVMEAHEGCVIRCANAVIVPTRLLEIVISPGELEVAQAGYFNAVTSAVRKWVEGQLNKDFWGKTILVDAALRNALSRYLEDFEGVASSYRPL